jgi:periplasmic protein CpxP/Spy
MLKHFVLALLLGGLIYVAPSALAQENSGNDQQTAPPATQGEHGQRHGHFDPAQHAAMLAKHLNLNSDQQTKVEGIFKSEQSQMEGLRADTSLSQEDRHAKMMDIHKSTSDQIRAVLDPDQQKKWDEMESKRGQWQGHHHGGEGQNGSEGQNAPPQQQQ